MSAGSLFPAESEEGRKSHDIRLTTCPPPPTAPPSSFFNKYLRALATWLADCHAAGWITPGSRGRPQLVRVPNRDKVSLRAKSGGRSVGKSGIFPPPERRERRNGTEETISRAPKGGKNKKNADGNVASSVPLLTYETRAVAAHRHMTAPLLRKEGGNANQG